MSYNVNIPVITDSILISSRQIKTNFQAINASYSANHVGLVNSTDASGKHNVLTFRPQMADPATNATQIALYNKLVSSIPELFFRPNNSQTPIQLTYPSLKTDGTDTQYSFAAGPFIIYFGKVSNPTDGQGVNLTPGTTLLYVDLTVTTDENLGPFIAMAVPTNISGTSFNISFQNIAHGPFDVFYMAVGQ